MRRAISALICLFGTAALATAHAARAQQVDQWTAIQQFQADLKADRQAVVAINLPLSEEEARAFQEEVIVRRLVHGDRLAHLGEHRVGVVREHRIRVEALGGEAEVQVVHLRGALLEL